MKLTYTYLHRLLWALALPLLLAMVPEKKITIYLIGDSTMSVKSERYYPETGWGMPFVYFFEGHASVDNRAMNGRSTRTFLEENRWQPVQEGLQEGDYVLIQFGHNDEVSTKKSYTNEVEYRANLRRFVAETRAKKAIPILLTPVARRDFDAEGTLQDTHAVYSELVRKLAAEELVTLVDLDRLNQQRLRVLGPERSKDLFVHLLPGEHPNYLQGKVDNTHFNEYGARIMAQIVLGDLRRHKSGLVDYVVRRE
ncbi:lysophospholipase L1-like esterase [Dyadobacter jejuensis]|uniref:Lysophospholipase L1-like esterase n=1 Tax=Dyadobacter jejuensis TaxID=1082580 RepID=A0A316ABQ2_9BACT|nr:rhamnogalacturonan acetylesterase [Dyadobacter jejuensis]PWJ55051.1 lysophospholipase L1-like esterase [Dyadobacter jejuensis]